MATTLSVVYRKCLFLTRENKHVGDMLVSRPEWGNIIERAVWFVASKVPLGENWETGALTITAGSDSATLAATTAETSAVLALRRNTDGRVLTRRDSDYMNRVWWDNRLASTASHADPEEYCIWETAAQAVTFRFQAPIKTSGTLDVLRSVTPAALLLDSTAVPFSRYAVEAIASFAAVAALTRVPKEKWLRRDVDRDTLIKVYTNDGMAMVAAEHERRRRLEDTGVRTNYAWRF